MLDLKFPSAEVRRFSEAILREDEYRLRPLRAARNQVQYIVDAGGNCGAVAAYMAYLFPGANLLVFEPDPECFGYLLENTRGAHAAVQCFPQALVGMDGPENVRFRCFPQWRFGNHIENQWESDHEEAQHDVISVETAKLPEIIESHGWPRIDLLKIDAEGAEADVLESLAHTGWMDYVRWIRGEWHGRHLLPRLRAALEATHEFSIGDDGRQGHGPLTARHHLDGD